MRGGAVEKIYIWKIGKFAPRHDRLFFSGTVIVVEEVKGERE